MPTAKIPRRREAALEAVTTLTTGKAGLLSRERRCRDAIEAGRVEYQLLHLPAHVIRKSEAERRHRLLRASAPDKSGSETR
jgi:hypothetical protein